MSVQRLVVFIDPLPRIVEGVREVIKSLADVVVGTGERCLPGDGGHCGDGGPADKARLAYPKGERIDQNQTPEQGSKSNCAIPGIAVAPDGTIYLADGANIRKVDENGIISTIVGHQHHR